MAFGKRNLKTETPSISSSSDSWSNLSSWAKQPEGFMPVIVRQSVVNASHENNYALIQGVIDYVNAVQSLGLYHRLEMPTKAIQAFHCDYYLAQVLNGGHSQFIHNALVGREFKAIIQDVVWGFLPWEDLIFLIYLTR